MESPGTKSRSALFMVTHRSLRIIFSLNFQPDEQQYALRSYDEDVEMADATAEDEDDEWEVESELDPEEGPSNCSISMFDVTLPCR